MANYRIKRIKHRPIDSRERLPGTTDAVDGKVLAYLMYLGDWSLVDRHVVWSLAVFFPVYWSPASKLS
jgi:hypothetical protein